MPKLKKTTESNASRWTFLTNHGHVLIVLAQNPDWVLRDVANRVNITERAVQKIVADLERDGYVKKERSGRTNRYKLNLNKPLRHPVEAHKTAEQLLKTILS